MSNGGFCVRCGHHVDSFDGLFACPNCGSTGVPASDDDQLTISINLHELRILCMWSEQWASLADQRSEEEGTESLRPVVYSIANRIKSQIVGFLESDKPISLTLHDELEDLKNAGFKFTTNMPNMPSGEDPS